jgi:hypothetical protein
MRDAMNTKIHGTYPFDDPRWRTVRKLGLKEVADLTGIEVTDAECKQHDEGDWVAQVYLWVNKGFIVIGEDAPEPGKYGFGCAMVECMLGGRVEADGIRSGAQAVYLADGNYYLIERK